MIQLVLILEIFGLQVDFNGWHSASWSLRWHQAQTAARSSCSHVSAGVQELDSGGVVASPDALAVQYVTAEWKPAFLSQAREFLFFPLLPREASK